jgi:hypothetical protein
MKEEEMRYEREHPEDPKVIEKKDRIAGQIEVAKWLYNNCISETA